ncbi:MAG TPA: sialidase family protein [Ktedonobacterales bacterium]|nr:sialidase family protein [Ktedonobacterales bacterium]
MRTWADQMTDACPQAVTTETLSAWRDATLAPTDAAFLARHTPTCRACADRLALFDAVEDALRQQRTPAPRPSLWGEVYARIADETRGSARTDAQRDDFAEDGYPSENTAAYSRGYPAATDSGAAGDRLMRLSPISRARQPDRSGLADGGRTPDDRQPLRRRWGALGAASAALLIAALLIGLLLSRSGFNTRGAHPTPTAHTPVSSVTATSTVASDGLPAGWQNLPVIANDPGQPVIAPSNPQVVYFSVAGSSVKGVPPTYLLARSDDGGVTIHHLPFPLLNGQTIDTYSPLLLNLIVSPLNPQTVYLYTQFDLGACPNNFVPFATQRVTPRSAALGQVAQRGAEALAGSTCQPEYVSTDGGLTWTLLNLPTKGLLGITPPDGNRYAPTIQAQGSRLYSTVANVGLASSGVPMGGRLVMSQDGGVTWTLVDAPIAAQGLVAYDFAAAPSGSTVFVVSENPQTVQLPTVNADPHLWRSDDAGATWTELGYTPGASATSGGVSGMAATVSANGQAIVYLTTSDANLPKSTTILEASADGGQTWQHAPDAGTLGETVPLGVSASNRVVMVFADRSYRGWALGDAGWTTMAPSLGPSYSSNLYFIGDVVADNPHKVALYAIGDINSVSVVARSTLP